MHVTSQDNIPITMTRSPIVKFGLLTVTISLKRIIKSYFLRHIVIEAPDLLICFQIPPLPTTEIWRNLPALLLHQTEEP